MNNLFNNKLIQPSIQWMIRRDLPSVLAIDTACHEHPWSEEEFIRCLRQRNCIGMVAKLPDEQIVGYMVYELHPRRLIFHWKAANRGLGCIHLFIVSGVRYESIDWSKSQG